VVSRLVIVSNRVALPGATRQAGGLAVAVNAALRKQPGVWFGWSGNVTDNPDPQPLVVDSRGITYVALDLPTQDHQEYYQGFANSVLWPILHYRVDLAEYTNADLSGYKRVNALFADRLAAFLQRDDTIWVHDYHLMTLAQELRTRGFTNSIGFFLHIPCPPPDILLTLPHHAETIGSLVDYDLVGFQTENDTENFCAYLDSRGAVRHRGRYFEMNARRVQVDTFPVSIATRVYARAARTAEKSPVMADLRRSLDKRKLILGVDRLDYSKGIIHRMQAYEKFLEERPEWREKVDFLQVTPKSREAVPGYKEMDELVSGLVGQINGKYGELAWTPINYVNKSYSRKTLAGVYRLAAAALVTPLRDGMNLVAKEFVAAQDASDPGVLVLSRFAGAASELDGAILVNPHETEGTAQAIYQALQMPLAERRDRHARMFAHIRKHDIDWWASQFLTRLAETRGRPSLISGLRNLLTTFTF
jgi:trehalose 6-phosphate synthase